MPTASTNAETKRGLNQTKHKFKQLPDGLSFASKYISKDIADVLVAEINTNYNSFVSALVHDGQNRIGTDIHAEKATNGYRVVVSGPQVLYDEFGTGDQGLMQPHPEKSKYDLRKYNSGEFIRTGPNGDHYWSYYSDKLGRYTSSDGVPAGMFIYYSVENVANDIARNIATEGIRKQIIKIMSKGK